MDRTIELIRENGCKPGLVLNPATPLDCLDHTLKKLDLVLLMSVNPGFGGQKFIPARARQGAQPCASSSTPRGRTIRLEIDGGVKVDNIGEIARAGADMFVAGSAIFGAKDYKATIAAMRAADRGREVAPRATAPRFRLFGIGGADRAREPVLVRDTAATFRP